MRAAQKSLPLAQILTRVDLLLAHLVYAFRSSAPPFAGLLSRQPER